MFHFVYSTFFNIVFLLAQSCCMFFFFFLYCEQHLLVHSYFFFFLRNLRNSQSDFHHTLTIFKWISWHAIHVNINSHRYPLSDRQVIGNRGSQIWPSLTVNAPFGNFWVTLPYALPISIDRVLKLHTAYFFFNKFFLHLIRSC